MSLRPGQQDVKIGEWMGESKRSSGLSLRRQSPLRTPRPAPDGVMPIFHPFPAVTAEYGHERTKCWAPCDQAAHGNYKARKRGWYICFNYHLLETYVCLLRLALNCVGRKRNMINYLLPNSVQVFHEMRGMNHVGNLCWHCPDRQKYPLRSKK